MLLTQARRLELLARRRVDQVMGSMATEQIAAEAQSQGEE
jgi:hypothetical protein